ncbi:MAG: hypothetical protein ACREXU_15415, partial [Gammaproteobacteria bacterium]
LLSWRASGIRTGVTNMAALWILVSSLVPLPSFYGAIAYDRQSGAYGFAYDQPSPVAAGRRALEVWTCNSTPGTEPPTAPLEPPYDGPYFAPAPR